MMKKWIAMVAMLAMFLTLAGCGGGEETTVTGMVVSLEGTVVSLMQMDGQKGGGFGGRIPMGEAGEMPTGENGEMPSRPENMEDFTMPEDFNPENMEDFDPENFDPEQMEGFIGGQMPPDGERPDMEDFGDLGETTTLDLAEAHISVEIDGGKESGTLENIVPGTFITVTVSAKGQATYVLVSQSSGFGGGGFKAMQ